MKHSLTVLALLFCVAEASFASERVSNGPYVQSLADSGVFYARCIPADKEGTKGSTAVYRVGMQSDDKLDSYAWYSPEGVVLAWSPIAGKVAVMSLREGDTAEDGQVELSFHLGGERLRSYTVKELKDMGVRTLFTSNGPRLDYTVVRVEQMPVGTNEYAFVVETNKFLGQDKSKQRRLCFDILTGKLRN